MFKGYGWAIGLSVLIISVFYALPIISFFFEPPLTFFFIPPLNLFYVQPLIISLEPPFLLSFKQPLNFVELRSFMFAIGGLLFSIPILLTWRVYTGPVLKIDENIERNIFDLSEDPQGATAITWTYEANRIIVKNVGRSAAKNCKGWIVVKEGREERRERVRWTVQSILEPNVTINVKDQERLDFCAYHRRGPRFYKPTTISRCQIIPQKIAPTEKEWPSPPKARSLDRLTECEVWITSENAEPAKKKVRFGVDHIHI